MAREHGNSKGGAGPEGRTLGPASPATPMGIPVGIRTGEGEAARPVPQGVGASALTSREFAAQFQGSYRLFWLVAAGIVGDRSGADDVVQEAAVLALERLEQFRPGTNFRAWMAQMVRFVALNHARRQQKHRNVGEVVAGLGPVSPSSLGTTMPKASDLRLGQKGELPEDQAHFDDRLVMALNSVNDVARACLLLRTVEHLEYSEISKLLSIPEGTAMSHVHRTRQYLRERLADLAPRGTLPESGEGGNR